MADPLPPAVHRHPYNKLKFGHFKWRGVGVSQQIADQLTIVADLSRALAVADASGLHNRAVIAHAVD